MKRLTEQVIRLQQAAETVCTDKAFVYDTIYLAVIKTKQKYKKLANKERVVDVCISLMKQPRKHVKQSFSSIEDCIEKALATKIVPWKPILSAVAVMLAVAIIIPVALPKQARMVDASGFVMEGTLSLENLVKDSTVELKNLHLTENLGAADPKQIADHTYGMLNNVHYESVTTSNGVTLLILTYADKINKKAEYIVYEALESGWQERHRVTIGFFTTTMNAEFIDENDDHYYKMTTFYQVGYTTVLPDAEGNVYILSRYAEGIQIHRYNADGSLEVLGQKWLAEYKQRPYPSNGSTNNWGFQRIHAALDVEDGKIAITGDFIDTATVISPTFLEFDITTKTFSEPVTVPAEDFYRTWTVLSPLYDGNDGWYFVLKSKIEGDTNYLYESVLVHFKNGQFRKKASLFQALDIGDYPHCGMLTLEDGKIHLVYYDKTRHYHAIYNEDGELLEKKRFYAVSTDSVEYLYFFLYEGKLHSLSYVSGKYIILSQVPENGRPIKLGEFLFPASMDDTCSNKYVWESLSPVVSGGNMLNVMITCSPAGMLVALDENMATYFMQITLPKETNANE